MFLQERDCKQALHWISIADRVGLRRLLDSAALLTAASNVDISKFPEAQHLSHSVLLQLMHWQYDTFKHWKEEADFAHEQNYSLKRRIESCTAIDGELSEKIHNAIYAAEKKVESQERQCDRRVGCKKCFDQDNPCRACKNFLSNIFEKLDRVASSCYP